MNIGNCQLGGGNLGGIKINLDLIFMSQDLFFDSRSGSRSKTFFKSKSTSRSKFFQV